MSDPRAFFSASETLCNNSAPVGTFGRADASSGAAHKLPAMTVADKQVAIEAFLIFLILSVWVIL